MPALEVTVYTDAVEEPDRFEVDFVSYVSNETWGKPALITVDKGERPVATVGETVLYINTSVVPFWTIQRKADGRASRTT